MRQLVRFGTAGQVYRVGEMIFPNQSRLKTKVPPPIPVGWNFGMRVGVVPAGVAGAGNVGYRDPAHGPGHGALNPQTFMGLGVRGITSVPTGSCFVWLGASVQAPGINKITVTVEGYATPMVCSWSNATPGTVSARYQLVGGVTVAFMDHLLANVGKVIGVTLVGSALVTVRFEPPYPWEPFTTHASINDWVEELDLEVPENWFSLTIAQKKAHLAETYGDG